jgi:hypothetical protein
MEKDMMNRVMLTLALLVLTVCGALAQTITPVPSLMNFQGRLARPDGTPVADGTYTLTFRIYDAPMEGSLRWEEQSSISVRNGVAAALLGSITPLSDTIFNNTVWLEIQIGTAAPLMPRQRISAVAYAFKANTVPDNSITGAKIADGSLTPSDFLGGILTPGGAAGGDLTGSYPAPELAVKATSLAKVSSNILTALPIANFIQIQQTSAPQTTDSDYVQQSFGRGLNPAPYLTGIDIYVGTSDGQPLNVTLQIGRYEQSGNTVLSSQTVTIQGAMGFQHFEFPTPILYSRIQDAGSHPEKRYFWFLGANARLRVGYADGNPLPDPDFGGVYPGAFMADRYNTVNNDRDAAFRLYARFPNVMGKIGVNESNPTYELHVHGRIAHTLGVYNLSDARYKQNITTFESALDTILNLRGVTYEWNPHTFPGGNIAEGRQIGFIAQEVEKVLPELVHTDANGYKAVAYTNIVPVLVEAIKSLKQENDSLKAELAALKTAVQELQKQEKRK